MEKITKEELQRPDAVTESLGRATSWVVENSKFVQIAVLTIFIAAIGYVGWVIMGERKEETAQAALYKAESSFLKLEEAYTQAEMPQTKLNAYQKVTPEAKKKTGDLMVDYKEPVEQFRRVIQDFPATNAATAAAIHLARLYYNHKLYAEQVGILETATQKARTPILKALSLNLLGVGYDAQGDCQKAINSWAQIESDKNMRFLGGDAGIKSGACFEKLGQADKARQTYERVIKEYAELDPQSVSQAKKFLRTLNKG